MAGMYPTDLSIWKYNIGVILIQQTINYQLHIGTCTTLMSESAEFEIEKLSLLSANLHLLLWYIWCPYPHYSGEISVTIELNSLVQFPESTIVVAWL